MMGGTPNFDRPADQDPLVLQKTISDKILKKQRDMFLGFNIDDTIFSSPALRDEQRRSNLTPPPPVKQSGTNNDNQNLKGTIYDKGR